MFFAVPLSRDRRGPRVLATAPLFAIMAHLDAATPADLTWTRLLGTVVAITAMAMAVVLAVVMVSENGVMVLLALTVPAIGFYVVLRGESWANIRQGEAELNALREAELRVKEQELTRKLKEADQMKDDLLAMVSHELRNPL